MDRDDERSPNDRDFQGEEGFDNAAEETEWHELPADDFADDAEKAEPSEFAEGEEFQHQQMADEDGMGEAAIADEQPAPSGSPLRFLPWVIGVVGIGFVGFMAWSQFAPMLTGGTTPAEQPVQTAQTGENTLPPPQVPASNENVAAQPTVTTETQQPAQTAETTPTVQPVQQQAQQPAQPAVQGEDPRVAELNKQLEDAKAREAQLAQQLDSTKAAATTNEQQLQSEIASLKQQHASPLPTATTTTTTTQQPTVQAPVTTTTSTDVPASTPSTTSTASSENMQATTDFRRSHARKKSRRSAEAGNTDSEAVRLQREVNARLAGRQPAIPVQPLPMPQAMPQPVMPQPMPVMQAPPQPTAAPGQWVLRSAQPGAAWVSAGGTNNLQRVVPGDKLPGLGTIVSIRMTAGRWVLEGTNGVLQ